MERPRVTWNAVLPVALLAAALAAVTWIGIASGGDSEPPTPLGTIGTPVRGAFVAPTRTPLGARPTPSPTAPRPAAPDAPGTPDERDATRRLDLAALAAALTRYNDEKGELPTTAGNTQTFCVHKTDEACKIKDVVGDIRADDPLGIPADNGYWYASDGDTYTVYASLEGDVDVGEGCETESLPGKANLICVKGP